MKYLLSLALLAMLQTTSAQVVSTFAGSTSGHADGTGTSAQFASPSGVAIDGSGNIYVTDFNA